MKIIKGKRHWNTSWWKYIGEPLRWEDGIGYPTWENMKTGLRVHHLPIGGLYVSPHGGPVGHDGLSIVCVIPYNRKGTRNTTTTWHIDSRASNCTLKGDTKHRCWVRHGTVGGTIHVDKAGLTCSAGAGSIGVEGFHGFLHHGVLRDA